MRQKKNQQLQFKLQLRRKYHVIYMKFIGNNGEK